ncbi:hypothetical protein HGRIS_002006 [Hohenbuehelia grisea]
MARFANAKGLRWTSIASLSLGVAALLNIIILVTQLHFMWPRQRKYSYVGDDKPRELPIKVRRVNMVFHDDPDHYALSGVQAWAEWNHLRPEGKGFAFLGDAYFPYDVTMWHQLHCLNHIRTVINNGDDGSDHTEHCFHYLRQGILCAADTTLEPGGTRFRTATGEIRAPMLNVTHTCRDWRQV